MKELTLQIKPVGNHCNIHCTYCYAYPFKSKKFNILSLDMLEKIIKEAFSITNRLIVSWHGGEPTMVGTDYFKSYMKIVNKYKKDNQEIFNMIQTNAILIDKEMAKFFKDNNFIVSVSLDGCEDSHNKNRLTYNKKGTFDLVMNGVNILREEGIYPPVIATVSQNTYDDCEENYNFFIKNGFTEIKFSPVYDSATDDFSINDEKWFDYLKKVFDIWTKNCDPNIKIREIDEILMWFAGTETLLCSNRGMCSKWISIDELGNIYPCEYLRSSNSYGNIKDISLKQVFDLKEYKDFVKKINYIPNKCEKCKLLSICHNGCPATRTNNRGELTYKGIYVYCNQRKKLFDYIKEIIEEGGK